MMASNGCVKIQGYYQKGKDVHFLFISSNLFYMPGFQEAMGTTPCSVVFFFSNERLRIVYYFLAQRNKYEYEGECLVLWITFKKELSNWEAGIVWSECVLCLWICIFKATQKPWNFLPWNVARCIYTWAMKWHIFRNACELRFWMRACKNVSQRGLSLNALQCVGKRAWIWSFGHIPNMKCHRPWLAS